MFTQFNRQGHRQLSAEITQELQALAQRHGLDVSAGGGQYGDTELIIKVTVRSGDQQKVEDQARRKIDADGRWVGGLKGSDFGTIFVSNGERFRFTGVNPGRPKFPISGERVRDGRSFKFPQHIAQLIIAQRPAAPAVQTQQTAQEPTAPLGNQDADDRYADLAAF